MLTLRTHNPLSCKVPLGLPFTEFIIRIGAEYIFKTDPELAIYGRYVKSKRLEDLDYKFKFSTLDDALSDLIN